MSEESEQEAQKTDLVFKAVIIALITINIAVTFALWSSLEVKRTNPPQEMTMGKLNEVNDKTFLFVREGNRIIAVSYIPEKETISTEK